MGQNQQIAGVMNLEGFRSFSLVIAWLYITTSLLINLQHNFTWDEKSESLDHPSCKTMLK